MKRIVLFMVMISMVCIASYAQKAAEGTKVLVAYFSATGNTEKAAQQVRLLSVVIFTRSNLRKAIPPPI